MIRTLFGASVVSLFATAASACCSYGCCDCSCVALKHQGDDMATTVTQMTEGHSQVSAEFPLPGDRKAEVDEILKTMHVVGDKNAACTPRLF